MLTPTQKTAVSNYIAATPSLSTLATSAKDVEIARTLNDRVIDGNRSITKTEALKWAATSGRFAKIKDASVLGSNSATIRSRCLVMLEIIEDGLDVADSAIIALLDAMITDGVLAAADKTALLAAANSQISKSQQLIGRQITPEEVGNCR